MDQSIQHAPAAAPPQTLRVGCVSFLNSKPLIDSFEKVSPADRDVQVRYDVPSRLLDDLENSQVDIALCPVIDYFRSCLDLLIVPVGGIACRGPTLTVRLYSRIPLPKIQRVWVDTDSHTSVALLRVLLDQLYHLHPQLIPYPAPGSKPTPGSKPVGCHTAGRSLLCADAPAPGSNPPNISAPGSAGGYVLSPAPGSAPA
ncbi:MAG: hypothetical protein IT443_06465, partial [Phycisphaeraceae bacterium]|nr:hypothetical protein [Phycisphaeraceae bacterium]